MRRVAARYWLYWPLLVVAGVLVFRLPGNGSWLASVALVLIGGAYGRYEGVMFYRRRQGEREDVARLAIQLVQLTALDEGVAVQAGLDQLAKMDNGAIFTALKAWSVALAVATGVPRDLIAQGVTGRLPEDVSYGFELHDRRTGEQMNPDDPEVPPEVAWAMRFHAAHLSGDEDMTVTLFGMVVEMTDVEARSAHVTALLIAAAAAVRQGSEE